MYTNQDRDVEVVVQKSDTQRITLEQKTAGIQINKEWRKTIQDEWVVSKGITIPMGSVSGLIKKLQAL